MNWPLACGDCGHRWDLALPPLPISAKAFVRLMRAQSRCVRCDSVAVEIETAPPEELLQSIQPESEMEPKVREIMAALIARILAKHVGAPETLGPVVELDAACAAFPSPWEKQIWKEEVHRLTQPPPGEPE
jgi:hypothetical protein